MAPIKQTILLILCLYSLSIHTTETDAQQYVNEVVLAGAVMTTLAALSTYTSADQTYWSKEKRKAYRDIEKIKKILDELNKLDSLETDYSAEERTAIKDLREKILVRYNSAQDDLNKVAVKTRSKIDHVSDFLDSILLLGCFIYSRREKTTMRFSANAAFWGIITSKIIISLCNPEKDPTSNFLSPVEKLQSSFTCAVAFGTPVAYFF